MARKKGLPKGQRYGWQYVQAARKAAAKRVPALGENIEATKFGRSSSAEDEVAMTYVPTNTTWPGNGWNHRRTTEAGYNRNTGILRIEFFTDGSLYDYGTVTPVPPAVAMAFRRAASPGQFINSTLEGYGYERVR